ncbi:MAG: hypothetical protein RL685_5847 [Pseudomonadota bacterium]|jgi:hypothetical protein
MLLGGACSSLRTTERVFDGQTIEGHYIASDAYAAYVEGAYREARGEWAQAEVAYRRALRSDGQSPQIWTRLGALACRDSLPRALEHFERALALEQFAPAWSEQARCLAARQRPKDALEAALQAVPLDPRGASSNLLVVRLYREASRLDVARAWLFSWLLLEPELETYGDELRRESGLLADRELTALTSAALDRHAARGHAPLPALPGAASATPVELLSVLRAGDLDRARELASSARISPLKLATLAIESGRADLALAQAELLVQANPHDSAALVAGLLAAALQQDERRFRELLRQTKADALPPRELALLLAKLLQGRIGNEAAESWRSAYLRALATRATPP